MMTQFVTNVVIALAWMFLQDTLTLNNLILGYIIGLALLYFAVRRSDTPFYLNRVLAGLELGLVFLYEVARSSLRVAYLILHPKLPVNPGLVAVPLDVTTDAQITILAGMITMTPGTLSVDVSPDRAYLYVHALELDDPDDARASFKNVFERRIMEVL